MINFIKKWFMIIILKRCIKEINNSIIEYYRLNDKGRIFCYNGLCSILDIVTNNKKIKKHLKEIILDVNKDNIENYDIVKITTEIGGFIFWWHRDKKFSFWRYEDKKSILSLSIEEWYEPRIKAIQKTIKWLRYGR